MRTMSGAVVREVRTALHDLCQPMTALQCRLFLGAMEREPAELLKSIEEALTQCERLISGMRALQVAMEDLEPMDGR